MKILQVPYTFHPDPVGGTEIYVDAMARQLRRLGVESVIAAPGPYDQLYDYDGLRVHRLGAGPLKDIAEIYGDGDPVSSQSFGRVLDRERPDIVHLHAFTREISIRIAAEVKRRGIPLVFTYHIPTNSCVRHTLMRWGTEICDGRQDLRTCTGCALNNLGLPKHVAQGLALLPQAVGAMVGEAGLAGDLRTALRMKQLVAMRHCGFQRLVSLADKIIVVCEWARAVLLRNGAPAEKLVCSRLGLCQPVSPRPRRFRPVGGPLHIAFFGRLTPLKGPDLLLRALRSAPDLDVRLDLYGVVQGDGGAYVQRLHELAGEDRRVQFCDVVEPPRVIDVLQDYDALTVPSTWFETGPLVVLEAFAAGIPVIGADLGGISELVEDGVNGLLVEPNSVAAWREALESICVDRELLPRLRDGIRFPRTVKDVAAEIASVYRSLPCPQSALSTALISSL